MIVNSFNQISETSMGTANHSCAAKTAVIHFYYYYF